MTKRLEFVLANVAAPVRVADFSARDRVWLLASDEPNCGAGYVHLEADGACVACAKRAWLASEKRQPIHMHECTAAIEVIE